MHLLPAGGSPPREVTLHVGVGLALLVTIETSFAVQPLIELARDAASGLFYRIRIDGQAAPGLRSGETRLREPLVLRLVLIVIATSLVLTACGEHRSVRTHGTVTTGQPAIWHPVAGRFRPDETTLTACGTNDFGCYEQAFGNVAYAHGPTAAIAALQRLLHANVAAVRGDCHTITHWIGSATLARYHGDAAKAVAHGSMICGSGFYHGLIEFALQDAKTHRQLVGKVRGMCSDRTALVTTYLRYQCIHGLGHALMIFSGDNLPWALSMCDTLGERWSQQSCSGGVFMQNFNPPSKLSPFRSTYVRKNHLLYPCDRVRARYKYYCYLQVTEHILSATRYDWKRAATTCAGAATPWRAICFQSFGRDASGASRYHPAEAYRLCRLAGAGLADCIYGVSRDFVNNDVGGRRAARFCNFVPPKLRGYCYYGIGTILGTFAEPARVARICRTLSREFARQCNGGLSPRELRLIVDVPRN